MVDILFYELYWRNILTSLYIMIILMHHKSLSHDIVWKSISIGCKKDLTIWRNFFNFPKVWNEWRVERKDIDVIYKLYKKWKCTKYFNIVWLDSILFLDKPSSFFSECVRTKVLEMTWTFNFDLDFPKKKKHFSITLVA